MECVREGGDEGMTESMTEEGRREGMVRGREVVGKGVCVCVVMWVLAWCITID